MEPKLYALGYIIILLQIILIVMELNKIHQVKILREELERVEKKPQ